MQTEGPKVLCGHELIAAERARQIEEEGWSEEHDDHHDKGEMALAAAVYAWPAPRPVPVKKAWPWDRSWFKLTIPKMEPTGCGCRSAGECDHWGVVTKASWREARIRDLTKAGALITAEIDRLIRAGSEVDA